VGISRSAFWTRVVTESILLDPMFLLGLSVLALAGITFFRNEVSAWNADAKILVRVLRFLRFAAVFGTLVTSAFFLEYYVIEKLWLKPALAYMRPPAGMRLGFAPVSAWFSRLVGDTLGSSSGAPSGFVLRQLMISLSGLLVLFSSPIKKNRRRMLTDGLLSSFFVIVLAWTAFTRVYSGHHYIFDVMIAVGIGTILFWIFTLAVIAAWNLRHRRLHAVSRECWHLLAHRSKMMLPFTLVVVLVLFLISGDSTIWGYMLPALMFIVSATLGLCVRMGAVEDG